MDLITHTETPSDCIIVENGILLAWYLNRTLLLPKALLGEAFGWGQFSKLYLQHNLRDTNNNYCKQFKNRKARKLASCPDPSKYTLASFDNLFDLSWAKQHVKIIEREDSSFKWLEEHFNIRRSLYSADNNNDTGVYVDGDILFFKDNTRYDWRIFDVPVKHRFLGKYVDSLDVPQLRYQSEKLIHFTSLFGSGKFPIKSSESADFFRKLQSSITYNHPAVLEMTNVVVDALGGPGNYIGVHLRSMDGPFVQALSDNIQHIVDSISAMKALYQGYQQKNSTYTLFECVAMAQNGELPLVFLATDAVRPRSKVDFRELWHHLPCTFTLNEIVEPDSPVWSFMDQYRTIHTRQSMRKFLMPLVDALVASRGKHFIGTKGSTFSGYIGRQHKSYWSLTEASI
ncbi:hypothetical protein BDF20DRAFT_908029 [Mycotypha africana]|uniref:uncharacterized protein n=1 Tax=Mycotypha africana TaxID=64632 RepID=UPI0023008591|nr:uncharacterized protein BDF20DRAFT_908029 [Mycotypha africana]KAI8968218.1 hypothetical protein BDF20DRAFT_908029 [Mycotypha africana]